MKTGDLRVWSVKNPPAQAEIYPVESPLHAHALIDALAQSQLLDKSITENGFGLEILCEDGEWEDWYDDEGRDLDEHIASFTEKRRAGK